MPVVPGPPQNPVPPGWPDTVPVYFGASVAAAMAWIPEVELDETTKPTLEQAETVILPTIADRVAAAVGRLDLLPADAVARTIADASGVVLLGVAAAIYDAVHPERARLAQESDSYGSVLWARFEQGLEQLGVTVGRHIDEAGGDPNPASPALPYFSFPPAMAIRDRRW